MIEQAFISGEPGKHTFYDVVWARFAGPLQTPPGGVAHHFARSYFAARQKVDVASSSASS